MLGMCALAPCFVMEDFVEFLKELLLKFREMLETFREAYKHAKI